MTPTRRIGPIGTTTRLIAAAALLYLALFHGTSWGLRWYDAVLGLVLLPALILALALVARHRGTDAIRFTGAAGTMLNCAVIVALLANRYTAGGAELFYGLTLIAAAWRAQPGCEATVISNWILRRDDQIGCPAFSPIDRAEARRASRTRRHHGRAPTSLGRLKFRESHVAAPLGVGAPPAPTIAVARKAAAKT